MISLIETITENTTFSATVVWVTAVAGIGIALWIQRTVQSVKDDISKIGAELKEVKTGLTSFIKREDFQSYMFNIKLLNPDLKLPEKMP